MSMTVVSVAFARAPVARGTAGGAEQIVAMIDDALVRAGHRSIVLAMEGSDVRGELAPIGSLRRILATNDVDVVHYHGLDWLDHYVPFEPSIVTVHLPPDWYQRWPENVHYICVSEDERKRFGKPCTVISNGVNLAEFKPAARDPRPAALFLGRICPEKNTHAAIEAAKLANAGLTIAGQVFDYPEHRRYFDEEVVPRLDARRRFIGRASMKARLIASARCVLIPSLCAETSSLVAMEAAACGTPVIAYRSGALPEIVVDGVTGFLVDDVPAMAEAIGRVDAIDRNACRRVAEERFDARRMTDAYLRLYDEVRCAASSR
jgi:glycosyltransferase involved in cell wall biosynthesis